MNKKERYFVKYKGDTRYEKVWEQMQLLGIEDVTTYRQDKNGTIVWRLPIKNEWPGNQKNATFIEVASFDSGYVRNQNSGYSNYQLNKRCEGEPEYFDSGKKDSMGRPLYTKWTTRTCELIPSWEERIIYLAKFIIKNYYQKPTYQISDYTMDTMKSQYKQANDLRNQTDVLPFDEEEDKFFCSTDDVQVIINGQRYNLS